MLEFECYLTGALRVYLQNMLYFKKKMICELCFLLRAWSELVLYTKGSFLLVFFWFQAGIVGNAFVIQMTMFPKNISLRSCFNFYMEFKLIQSKYKTRYGKCGWGVWRRRGGGGGRRGMFLRHFALFMRHACFWTFAFARKLCCGTKFCSCSMLHE